MKIANKISISFFAAGLILTGIAAPIFYMIAKNTLRNSIYNNLSTAVNSRTNHIETYLEMLKASVGELSKSTVLENFLKINGKGDPRQVEAFEQAMKRLANAKEVNPEIAEFLLMDISGNVAASSNERSIGSDKSTDVFFLSCRKGIYIKDVYYSEIHKEPLLAVSAPFLDSQTGKFLGVLAARVRLTDLNNIVTKKTGLGSTGEIYIINKYGYMITPSRFKEDAVLKQKVDTENERNVRLHKSREHLLSIEKPIGVFYDYRGRQVLGTHEYIPQMQWGVLAKLDVKEAFAPLAKIHLVFLAVLLIVPFAAWLLGIGIARYITEPLHKLYKGTEIISAGDLDYKVSTNAKDEVGQLSQAFDEMVEHLKKNTTSIKKLNEEITERKKSEEKLTHFQKAVDSATDGIGMSTPEGRHYYQNEAFTEMFGLSIKETDGASGPPATVYADEKVGRKVFDAIMRGNSFIGGVKMLDKGRNEKDILLRAYSIKDEKGKVIGLVGIHTDITESKRNEERLANYAKELVQINKELEDFTYMISHDLKEPLRSIEAFSKFLSDDYTDTLNEEAKNYLNRIRANSGIMQNLIDDLLDISRIERAKNPFTEEAVEDLINEAKFRLAYVIEQKHVEITVRGVLPRIMCDRVRMAEVFVNLISNAIKFNDKPKPFIEIGCEQKDGWHTFSVTDNGPGIEEKYFDKIFEIFQRLGRKEDSEGTGAGLTIAKKIVQMHGGRIWVKSEIGKGTTFFFTVPVTKEARV